MTLEPRAASLVVLGKRELRHLAAAALADERMSLIVVRAQPQRISLRPWRSRAAPEYRVAIKARGATSR